MKPIGRWVHKPFYRIGAAYGAKATGAKLRGQRYHRNVYGKLRKIELPDGWVLLVEPWYKNLDTQRHRSPDSVLIHEEDKVAIVIEVKLNWADGRDVKLIQEYLHIVKAAHKLDVVYPLLITQCLRGYPHPPLLGLSKLFDCQCWFPGDPTPLLLQV